MSERGLRIERRCEQTLRDFERTEQGLRCAQCEQIVVDLSAMRWAEYQAWLARRATGVRSCVRAAVDREGRLLLAPEPSPSPARRSLPIVLSAASLVACDPPAQPTVTREGARSLAAPVTSAPTLDAASWVAPESLPREAERVHERRAEPDALASGDASDPAPRDASADGRGADGSRSAVVRVRHPHPPGRHRVVRLQYTEIVGLDY